MAKLTDDMKSYFGKQLPMIATVDAKGNPNIGPKRTLRIHDDSTLIYNENTGGQTFANIKENGKAAVALVDWDALDGYRFVGTAKYYEDGEYYDLCCKYAEERKQKTPKAAVVIDIEEIYTLKIGPTAGTKLQ